MEGGGADQAGIWGEGSFRWRVCQVWVGSLILLDAGQSILVVAGIVVAEYGAEEVVVVVDMETVGEAEVCFEAEGYVVDSFWDPYREGSFLDPFRVLILGLFVGTWGPFAGT